ncbi:MAG: sigma-70 family RNA polymerase sigma factor [Marinobacter sp.]|uniref:sigma-70 family RNA polymerase sigma factor n=1 Tax=Marinobacter sp. TaxID=50741 RepID=UPI001B4DFAD6|nr:sigma-70 family RNA polymerase sigma factor [Marinobacter sp.]MBQ0746033.1 sigma-70 family RNA polymerase sigma factor [Marinobacter sp.]MBQ0814526.1 sigma-70 family RNA polymerase sigma factor [Marinobacter sp.]|tara:strand:+ start:1157 stop:1714 length:558 start_codon:yes stop_codon:yes gene_type:complete
MVTSNSEQDELMGLLIAVSREDRQAFQQLYEKISGRMFGLCLKLGSQQELAEEALQDAFIQIWHRAAEYHSDRGAPLSWMMTIARYRTLDLMRSRKAKQTSGDSQLEHVEDQREGPLDVSLRSAGTAELTGCFDELSDVQRDSILLSYYRGFTHDEVSEALSSPIGTVKSWIRRGLMVLKRCLER